MIEQAAVILSPGQTRTDLQEGAMTTNQPSAEEVMAALRQKNYPHRFDYSRSLDPWVACLSAGSAIWIQGVGKPPLLLGGLICLHARVVGNRPIRVVHLRTLPPLHRERSRGQNFNEYP